MYNNVGEGFLANHVHPKPVARKAARPCGDRYLGGDYMHGVHDNEVTSKPHQ